MAPATDTAMANPHVSTFQVRLLTALLFTFTMVSPVSSAAVSESAAIDGLSVTLGLDRTSLEVGQPLTLTIDLANVSPDPTLDLTASFQFPEGNDVTVMIQPPNELAYRYAGAIEQGSYPALSLALENNQPQTVNMMLLYDETQPSGLVFPAPGTYKLSVDFSFSLRNRPERNYVSLSEQTINVSPATGDAAEALTSINSPELLRALHLGVVQTTAILNYLNDLAARYPQTELGRLSLRTVGLHLVNSDRTTAEQGATKLLEYLKLGAVGGEGDRTSWYIARAYHTAGRFNLAREWMFYLERQHTGSIYLRPQDPLAHYYIYGPQDFSAQVPWYLLKEPWIIPGSTPPTNLNSRQEEL